PAYPTKLWINARAQMGATKEVDLSNSARTERPSLLTPTKVAALKKVNKQNRPFFGRFERGEIRPFFGRLIFLRPFGRMFQQRAAETKCCSTSRSGE
ncbi:unnamed protein product, partial [Sphacelaria rigidula]